MKVVYIAGAYRSSTINGIYDNIQIARQEAIKWWEKGYAVICPHLNSGFMDGICPDKSFLDGGIELLKRSDIVVMLPNWKDSIGAKQEHRVAIWEEKEIIYLEGE